MNKKQIFSLIGNIIYWLLLFFSICILIFGIIGQKNNKQLKLFGYSFSVVVTPSMEDTINVNDIIIVKDSDFKEIKEQDIIVYYNSSANINVVHRVIKINDDGSLVTKGDNNSSPDSIFTTEANYIGKVVSYGSYLGLGKLLTNSKSVIFIVLILIFLYILIINIKNIFKINKEKNEEILKQNNTIDKEKMREEILKEIENSKTREI